MSSKQQTEQHIEHIITAWSNTSNENSDLTFLILETSQGTYPYFSVLCKLNLIVDTYRKLSISVADSDSSNMDPNAAF